MSCFPAGAEEDNNLEGEIMEETKETKTLWKKATEKKTEQ